VRKQIDQGVDMVVASGGDGTVSAVASGMLNSAIPLGILPTGTGNVFARDIGIPVDFDHAIKLITGEHALLELDMMLAHERAFVMNLSLGLSANTILKTERGQKKVFGLLAYAWNAVVNFFGISLETFHLVIDGSPHKIRAAEIMVINSSLIGLRTLQQKTNVIPDDGKVEVCVFRARTVGDWLAALGHVLIGHRERNTLFKLYHARESISITTRRPMNVQGDGEFLGSTPLQIRVMPGAARIIVPNPTAQLVNLPHPFNRLQIPLNAGNPSRRANTPPEG
jgi:diacylglycerol kinase family enzyme